MNEVTAHLVSFLYGWWNFKNRPWSCLVFIETVDRVFTSAGIGEFGPAEEAEVSGSSPDGLRVSEAESGVEMIRLQRLVSIDGEVPAGVVAAVNPDLETYRSLVV